MSFSFNAVELCVMTINEKPWARAREVRRVLEYGKATKTANTVKAFCSKENYAHKYLLSEFVSETNFMDWPKDSRKDHYYINEEGMYEIVFSSQRLNAKDFRRHCCNLLFPHVRQQLTNKMKEDHQQAIEEKDAAIALLNDDLQNRKYENVGLQGEIRAKDQQLAALQRRYVGYLSDEDKNNGISIIAKNNEKEEYPYISIFGQHGYRRHKARVLLARNKGSTLFADRDTPNAIVTYNLWREHGLIVVDPNRPRHFRLDMINQEQFLTLNDT